MPDLIHPWQPERFHRTVRAIFTAYGSPRNYLSKTWLIPRKTACKTNKAYSDYSLNLVIHSFELSLRGRLNLVHYSYLYGRSCRNRTYKLKNKPALYPFNTRDHASFFKETENKIYNKKKRFYAINREKHMKRN